MMPPGMHTASSSATPRLALALTAGMLVSGLGLEALKRTVGEGHRAALSGTARHPKTQWCQSLVVRPGAGGSAQESTAVAQIRPKRTVDSWLTFVRH
jgi:hypothetical protein